MLDICLDLLPDNRSFLSLDPLQKITLADIAKFEEEYKGSEEELADLKAAYLDGDGDMNYIMDNVLCAVQGCNSMDN